jgi:hypothetical protein
VGGPQRPRQYKKRIEARCLNPTEEKYSSFGVRNTVEYDFFRKPCQETNEDVIYPRSEKTENVVTRRWHFTTSRV